MMHHSTNWLRLSVLLLTSLSLGCKPYNLDRVTFPDCAKPSATIGYTPDKLEVVFSLNNKSGDFGAIGWDLGDGRHKMGDPLKIAYSKAGTYTVTVIAANACDDVFTISRSITVTD